MLVHLFFLAGVDLSRFSVSACGHNFFRECVKLALVATGQKHSCTFPCKRSGNSSSDRSASSVDHAFLLVSITFSVLSRLKHHLRPALGHESCELALERFGYASAPALGQGLGRGIRENILFAFLQPIEDALRRGLGRGLRYLEAS